MNHVLLLDVDGVIFRHPRVLKTVGYRVTRFVQSRIPQTCGLIDAHQVNKQLYTNYGHTLLGMHEVYSKNAPSLEEFNHVVYRNIDKLLENKVHEDAQLRTLCEIALAKDVPIYLFSNAPHTWCQTIIEHMDLCSYIPEDRILSSDHPVFQEKLLKPVPKLYENVQTYLQQEHHNKDLGILFVDDSWGNLKPVIRAPGWKPMHFNRTVVRPSSKIQSPFVISVSNFAEVAKQI